MNGLKIADKTDFVKMRKESAYVKMCKKKKNHSASKGVKNSQEVYILRKNRKSWQFCTTISLKICEIHD